MKIGFATQDTIREDPEAAKHQPLLKEASGYARFSFRGGRYALASTVDTEGTAYLGRKTLVRAMTVTALSRTIPGLRFARAPVEELRVLVRRVPV